MDTIGDRFKRYEAVFDYALPQRVPMIVRVDGRAFHGLKLEKPFDKDFFEVMDQVTVALCEEAQGCVLGYHQSDEVSIVLRDDVRHESQPWFGKRLSKVVSAAAAVATETFSRLSTWGPGYFDARAFVVPDVSEVLNYLLWRQMDAQRNSVQMLARAHFSAKQLHGVDTAHAKEMLDHMGVHWEGVSAYLKRGAICVREGRLGMFGVGMAPSIRYEWLIQHAPPFAEAEVRLKMEAVYRSPGES